MAETKQNPDQFALLKTYIDIASQKEKEVYVLSMSTEDFPRPDETAQELKKLEGIEEALTVNGTLDCILSGDKEKVGNLAEQLHIQTSKHIGCVLYTGENMTDLFIRTKSAIAITRRRNLHWHIYDPDHDSLKARIEKADYE